ncbi:MAG: DUF2281 domain-containing protein [Saprospiraceae bacterium]
MNAAALTNKINLLPEDVQKQVADFVEYLLLKYQVGTKGNEELTPDQKDELLRLWNEYEENPEEAISLETFQEQTSKKYGL